MNLTTAESVAAAIRAEMPSEDDAPQIALDIETVAELRKIPLEAALAYVHDRPRPTTFSAPGFLRFCERYHLTTAAELAEMNTKEPSSEATTTPPT